jgi:hypothetical protein
MFEADRDRELRITLSSGNPEPMQTTKEKARPSPHEGHVATVS